jgi:hypothetical protein
MREEIIEKIRDEVSKNPVVIEFLNNAMIDDLLTVSNVLDTIGATGGGGISLNDYYIIQDALEPVEEVEESLPSVGGFTVEDIKTRLEFEEDIVLNDEEADRLFQYISNTYWKSESIGLSWDLIPVYYDNWNASRVAE